MIQILSPFTNLGLVVFYSYFQNIKKTTCGYLIVQYLKNHNQWLLTKRHTCPTSAHVLEFLIVVVINHNQTLDFWEPWLSRCKIALVPKGVSSTNNFQTLVCSHEGVERHGIQNSKKAMKGVGIGFLIEYSLFWGPKIGNICLGLGQTPWNSLG